MRTQIWSRTARRLARSIPALALALAVSNVSPAAGAAHRAGPHNVNTSRSPGNQNETSIVIDPANPRDMVGTSNVEFGAGLVHVWSTDGGVTWKKNVIADGGPLGSACCDSQLAADEFGNVFLVYLTFRVEVALSVDGGATFHPLASLTPPGSVPVQALRRGKLPTGDQPSIAAAEGEVWASWTSFSNGKIQASGAAVTGLGQVGPFSSPQTAQGSNKGDYGDTVIGPDGQVMVTYQNPTGGEGPATIYTDLDPDGLGPTGFRAARTVAVTNVGGYDYIPAQNERSVDAEAGLAWDRTGGTHNGRLYIMYTTERPDESDDLDVQLRYSDDQGATWSPELRVNDDSTTSSQFLPRIALDQTTGNLAISWYDCRNDRGNHGPGDTDGVRNDDAVMYAAVSEDGGQTMLPNIRVGAGVSNATDSGSGLDYGDYEGLAFHGGVFLPLWADNSNSTGDNPDGRLHALDLYTAVVTVP